MRLRKIIILGQEVRTCRMLRSGLSSRSLQYGGGNFIIQAAGWEKRSTKLDVGNQFILKHSKTYGNVAPFIMQYKDWSSK